MEKKLLKLNIIDRDGNKQTIETEEGLTIREAIMDKLAPGMFALCEGNCICATCHVHVAEEDYNKLKKPQEDEIETMATNDIIQTSFSRLSCQVKLEKELDGLTVTIAPTPSL
tara:strand:+ start:172 stop:510 length:339 start_codon:yes stop_codon:yes gene_type:complete